MPTQDLRAFVYNTAFRTVSLNRFGFLYATHTPARTLVMSRTRIPANGSVGESAAAVAKPLQSELLEPLSRMRGLRYLARPRDVLEKAIKHREQTLKLRKTKRKYFYVAQCIKPA